jgi:hypothetical protein
VWFEKIDREAEAHYYSSKPVKEFYKCLNDWEEETGHISSVCVTVANKHFLRIIGMGTYLFEAVMKELPKNWFLTVVLTAWSGTEPGPEVLPKDIAKWWEDHFKDENNYRAFFDRYEDNY